MLYLCALLSVLSTGIAGLKQAPDRHALIEWNEFYELQWNDFKGTPTPESIGDAGTVVHIKAKPFLVKKQVKYDVYAFFDKGKSWYRDRSESLLAHERIHFDIAELYARKIRKKISELRKKGVNNVKVYNKAINQIIEESNETDRRYDIETLHGALTRRQVIWERKVREELSQLDGYKKNRRIISKK